MNVENALITAVCMEVNCTTDKCACRIGGRCKFNKLPKYKLAEIARDRYKKRNNPEKYEDVMRIINRAYPAKAVVL